MATILVETAGVSHVLEPRLGRMNQDWRRLGENLHRDDWFGMDKVDRTVGTKEEALVAARQLAGEYDDAYQAKYPIKAARPMAFEDAWGGFKPDVGSPYQTGVVIRKTGKGYALGQLISEEGRLTHFGTGANFNARLGELYITRADKSLVAVVTREHTWNAPKPQRLDGLVNLMERHPKITGTGAVIAGAAALGVLFIA